MDFLLHQMVKTSADRHPEKVAVLHENESLTYRTLYQHIDCLASTLQGMGCQRHDRVGIYLDPSIPQVVSIFSISLAGGVFVPINHLLLADQVSHIVNDCGMAGLVVSWEKWGALKKHLASLKSLRFLVIVRDLEHLESEKLGQCAWYEDVVKSAPKASIHDQCIEKDLAGILYTSGSTGKPKGVMVTHAQVISGSSIVSTYLGITENEKILAILPFSFDAGLNQVMTSIQQSATLVLKTFVFAREIVNTLQEKDITGLAGVPTLWNLIAQPNSGLQKTHLPHLRYITNTGGAMPQKVLARLRTCLPTTKIFLMYGLTEAFRSTYLPPEELDARPTSMGKAIPNTEILVVNEQGESAKPGEIGELVHRGPTVSLGYWEKPELTNQVLRPHPFLPPEQCGGEKVCYSGDLVRMDEQGFLYFVGRRDSMIKSAGFRISRTEVEEAIYQSGLVKEVAVIGVPDEVLGQSVKAIVVLLEEGEDKGEAILSHCVQHLPRYMVPKLVKIVQEIPKTHNQKIDYTMLQNRETATACL